MYVFTKKFGIEVLQIALYSILLLSTKNTATLNLFYEELPYVHVIGGKNTCRT